MRLGGNSRSSRRAGSSTPARNIGVFDERTHPGLVPCEAATRTVPVPHLIATELTFFKLPVSWSRTVQEQRLVAKQQGTAKLASPDTRSEVLVPSNGIGMPPQLWRSAAEHWLDGDESCCRRVLGVLRAGAAWRGRIPARAFVGVRVGQTSADKWRGGHMHDVHARCFCTCCVCGKADDWLVAVRHSYSGTANEIVFHHVITSGPRQHPKFVKGVPAACRQFRLSTSTTPRTAATAQ